MQISWDDIGRSTEPGDYEVNGVTIIVERQKIKVWQQHPDAIFTIVPVSHAKSAREYYRLGLWEFP